MRCLTWLKTISATGATVIIPEIAHYEVRRELLRIRAIGSIKAAEFWASLRQSGIPTASPEALDADAILAGQAALAGQPGDTVTIATTTLAHLSRFPGIDAQIWDQIQ